MVQKGISTIIATILMVIITISLAGAAWIFVSGVFTAQTAQSFYIVNVNYGSVIIRNDGTEPISSMTAYIDNQSVGVNFIDGPIQPGKTGVVITGIAQFTKKGSHTLRLYSSTMGQSLLYAHYPAVAYDEADPTTFGGGWGWDGWQACCRVSDEKYSGSYSYKVLGGSEAWTSPLPDASDADFFVFAYKKDTPTCRANLYWYTNGNWHQVREDTPPFSYPGFGIQYYADTNWHVAIIDLNTQVASTGGRNENPKGVVTNFEYGPGGSCYIWYDYTFFI